MAELAVSGSLEDYAKVLVKVLNDLLGLEVVLRFDSVSPHYSYLEKDLLKTGGRVTLLSAVIGLNLPRLQTRNMVRRALAHEYAHLFPSSSPHAKRWSLWLRILRQVEKLSFRQGVG